MASPIDTLTTEQKICLDNLVSEIRLDKITVSFSIEDRAFGGKKSAFVSQTASRGHGAEMGQMNEDTPSANWSVEEAALVHCVLSKQVVAATYRDAVHRRIISAETAREELLPIIRRYDENIVRLMNKANGNGQ
jgi:hypothetical protein